MAVPEYLHVNQRSLWEDMMEKKSWKFKMPESFQRLYTDFYKAKAAILDCMENRADSGVDGLDIIRLLEKMCRLPEQFRIDYDGPSIPVKGIIVEQDPHVDN